MTPAEFFFRIQFTREEIQRCEGALLVLEDEVNNDNVLRRIAKAQQLLAAAEEQLRSVPTLGSLESVLSMSLDSARERRACAIVGGNVGSANVIPFSPNNNAS